MATRRSLGAGGEREYDESEDFGSDDLAGLLQGSGGRTDEFGNLVPDFANDPNFPTPFVDYTPPEIAGDTMTGRELFNNPAPTTPLVPRNPNVSRPMDDGLPKGMTVQAEQGYSDDFGGTQAISAPAQSFEPTPVSSRPSAPMAETRRVSAGGAPSALFSDASGGGQMFGRAGGLMGGGKGVLGSNEGGPAPTEMMLSLLRMFRGGA